VFARVLRREEVYSGPAVASAPDLIPEVLEHGLDCGRWAVGLDLNPMSLRIMGSPTLRMGGNHSPQGVLLAHGPHTAAGEFEGLNISDVAPTVLYALGLPVPIGLDGRVRTDLFDDAFARNGSPVYQDAQPAASVSRAELSADDQATIEQRLAGLGYL
jgi:predicted AlkP superfamily phosphohydrolase/phosphomutase